VRRRVAAAGVLVSGFLAAGSAQPTPALVTIQTIVTAADGSAVTGLARDDFELRVDDVERPVETFVARTRPTTALLVDVSASVVTVPGTLEEAVACLVDGLEPRDRLRVGALARHLFLGPIRSDYRAARGDLRQVLNPTLEDIVGPTPLWDAVAYIAGELAKGPTPAAILLVTDGRSTGNRLSLAQAAQYVVDARVSLNVLVVGPPEHLSVMPQDGTESIVVRPGAPIAAFAEFTGGGLQRISAHVPPGILASVFAQLRETYTLGFRSVAADGEMHRIAVRVRRAGLTVRAPHGYIASPTGAGENARSDRRGRWMRAGSRSIRASRSASIGAAFPATRSGAAATRSESWRSPADRQQRSWPSTRRRRLGVARRRPCRGRLLSGTSWSTIWSWERSTYSR
jgi:VWFA-related protein